MTLSNRATAPYLFGDTDLAAERLRLLAQVFAASTREFLEGLVQHDPRSIVDLGCGPGYTTRLLADVFSAAQVLGLDSSPRFVEIARKTPSERIEFRVAEVTEPLPCGPHDLVYSRYLLTHLARPREVIVRWSEQLSGGGLIVIEENEWIHTREPAFARYLEIVEAMLAEGGQRLYVGAELAAEQVDPTLSLLLSEVVSIPASDVDAAGMFLMNIPNWRQQPFIQRNVAPSDIDALVHDLERLAQGDPRASSIAFGRRRLVLVKKTANGAANRAQSS